MTMKLNLSLIIVFLLYLFHSNSKQTGGGGGGGFLFTVTLNLNNFFNIWANALKLHDFFKNISLNIFFPYLMSLAHIRVPVPVLVTFCSILVLSRSFGKIKKPKAADRRWPPFGNQDLITTLYDVITWWCEPQTRHFWTYYLPCKSHCHSLYTCEVMEGVQSAPSPGADSVKGLWWTF